MKNHPFSILCTYVMAGAVIAWGLSGIILDRPHMLPAEWTPLVDLARTVIVVAAMVAFIAVSLLSMRAASFAETAWRAGKSERHVLWGALVILVGCLVIEVYLGKFGAEKFGLDVGTIELTGALVFLALAPRIMAWVSTGIGDIEAAKVAAADDKEHRQTLDRIRVVNETTTARIDKGVSDLEEERKSRGGLARGASALGAAAALLGASAVDVPEASANIPIPFEERPQLHVEPSEDEDIPLANIPTGEERPWKRGPNLAKRNAFVEALNLLRENPEMGVGRLAQALEIDRKTARQWRMWALSIIEHPINAELFDAA